MFTIQRHGVPQQANGLSATQNLLAQPDTAPILVIGAPTGAGKTFGFQKLIQNTRCIVLFIVPTQALARNICESMERQGLYAKQWDSQQTRAAIEQGLSTWTDRLHSLTVEARQNGGMIVATLEAFHGITLGYPTGKPKVDFNVQDIFDQVDWLVFDEAHLLNERAMGFMALWATLTAFRRQRFNNRTRLALLSATHSPWVDFLVRRDENNLISLPPEWVDYQPETAVDLDEALPSPPGVRPIHDNVSVELHRGEIRELALELIPALLARPQRVLLVYDSLAEFGLDEPLLEKAAQAANLNREQVFVVNSQDKQAGETLGSARFPAGWEIPHHSRLIIGTSAVEVGMNVAHATALITDEGFNAAALLQRIGRVARGNQSGEVQPGEVHVVCNPRQKAPHIHQLEQLSGMCSIGAVIDQLKSPWLIPFNIGRARLLGSAYLDMLARQNRNLSKGLNAVLEEIEKTEGQRPLSGRSLLGLAHREVEQFRGRLSGSLKNWLAAIDRELRDLRGFTPTVKVRFQDGPVIQCSLDFVQKRLPLPDDYDGDVLVYRRSRDQCLKNRADPIPVVDVIRPFGPGQVQDVWNPADLQEKYRLLVSNNRDGNRKELQNVVRFATASGLAPRVPIKTVNAERGGSIVL